MIVLKWYKEGKKEKMLNQLQVKEDDIFIPLKKIDINSCIAFIFLLKSLIFLNLMLKATKICFKFLHSNSKINLFSSIKCKKMKIFI